MISKKVLNSMMNIYFAKLCLISTVVSISSCQVYVNRMVDACDHVVIMYDLVTTTMHKASFTVKCLYDFISPSAIFLLCSYDVFHYF